MINITNNNIVDIVVGSTPIEQIYLGNQLVWEKAAEEYIPFVDSVVHTICATTWGDYNETVITDNGDNTVNIVVTFKSMLNTTLKKSKVVSSQTNVDNTGGEYTPGTTKEAVGITATQCAAVTNIGRSVFRAKTNIQYFNELVYFTNATFECYGQQGTFANCSGLKEITFPLNAKYSNATYGFAYMFNNCTNLSYIGNIEYLNTAGAKNLSCMFNKTSKLTGTLDLHNWNVSSVTDCSQMFSGTSVSIINISGWTLGNNCNCNYMFQRCPNLTTINFGTFNFGKITHVYYMFVISPKVANITGAISGIDISLDMLNCPLTQESVVVLFNGLVDLTGGTAKSITFRKTVYDAIDETTMAIATGKNWNVVRSTKY